jgi:5'-3' exonuclease
MADTPKPTAQPMQVHLVDATYELFRAHFSPRPPVRGRDGIVLSGVSGLVEQLCYLVREQGATHVGCATDQVVRSFRNHLYAGYKSEEGMDPAILAQFPVAEAAIAALGFALWPMVEYEADDAIAAAAERFAADPRVERVFICSADKDMAQCVRGERVVLWDRRRDLVYDDAGVRAKWGVAPASVPDRLALVGDASDGFPGLPGWGDKSASAVLARYGHLEFVPANGSDWDVPGLRNPVGLAATLRDRMDEALLYRDLARLRTTKDGVPIPQADVGELRWQGADRARWEAFCDAWGLPRLRARPPRWREG